METVVLDGVQYVKASVIAERFKYTPDYVGQLCRSKKLNARLVGRTWFVNPESVKSHKKSKYTSYTPPKSPSETTKVSVGDTSPSTLPVAIKRVEPPLRRQPTNAVIEKQVLARKLRVDYEPDDGALLPALQKKHYPPPKRLVIRYPDAKKVSIQGRQTPVSFKPDELPEVSLSGSLKVTTAPEVLENPESLPVESVAENTVTTSKNKAISADGAPDKIPTTPAIKMKKQRVIHPTSSDRKRRVPVVLGRLDAAADTEKRSVSAKVAVRTDSRQSSENEIPAFADLMAGQAASFAPKLVQQQVAEKVSLLVRMSPMLATVTAVLLVALLFSVEGIIHVGMDGYQASLFFSVDNLMYMLSQR